MNKRIELTEATIENNHLILQPASEMVDIEDVKARGQMLVDSDNLSFIYILESAEEFVYAGLPHTIWTNLKEAKEKWGDKICICGNVDCGIALVYGPKQRIIEEVKRCINDAAEGGGYMLSSSNTIHYGVPIKNYEIMVETGRKYGVYR